MNTQYHRVGLPI